MRGLRPAKNRRRGFPDDDDGGLIAGTETVEEDAARITYGRCDVDDDDDRRQMVVDISIDLLFRQRCL